MRSFESLPRQMRNDAVKEYYDILSKRQISIALKRVFDFSAALILLIILSPIMILVSLAIVIDSKGGVIFKQERVTAYCRHFYIYKFRTMVKNAESIGTQVTVKEDARITKVGKVLRKFHLDEVPQLINILKGDMSFVGTRPEVPKYVGKYTDEMFATLLLPAGVTSMASIKYKDEYMLISNAKDCDAVYIGDVLPDKMKYNLEALKKFSFFFDIGVMFKTFFSVFINDEGTRKPKQNRAIVICEDARSLILTRKELLEEIMNYGTKLDVLVPYDNHCETLKQMGINVIDVPFDRRSTNPIKDIKLYNTYKKLIGKNYDFGITYSIKPNIYGGMALKSKKIPYYINVTGTGSVFYKGGLLKMIIEVLYMPSSKKASGLFFENSNDRDVFVNAHLCKKENTYVFSGAGINTSEFPLEDYPTAHPKKILYIGRLMEEKGIEDLYPVISELNSKTSDVVFEFLGEFEDTYKDKFDKFLKLDNVNYYGYQNNVKDYIKNASALVLPSYHEGMANVLLEAGAMGRPLITSDIPGCREAVDDTKSGYLFKVADSGDLSEKIKRFLSLSNEEARKMGVLSREHICSHFERKDTVDKIINITGVKRELAKDTVKA